MGTCKPECRMDRDHPCGQSSPASAVASAAPGEVHEIHGLQQLHLGGGRPEVQRHLEGVEVGGAAAAGADEGVAGKGVPTMPSPGRGEKV